ncbi:MAG: DUF177 domain-containing protein [Marinilabiliaceae bacterium]|nr:DUF177 domain-containing protein [Marinilabiliaceae bacterium]
MKAERLYIIQFKGLKDGVHSFIYSVDSNFFSLIEDSMYKEGNISVELTLTKSVNMLILDFCLNGTISSVCDNCLEPIEVPVSNSEKFYIRFGDQFEELTENSLIIPQSENEIDISKILYDIIVTSLPMRHLHDYDENGLMGCNPEMIEKLREYSSEKISTNETDPRWEGLKKLIDK